MGEGNVPRNQVGQHALDDWWRGADHVGAGCRSVEEDVQPDDAAEGPGVKVYHCLWRRGAAVIQLKREVIRAAERPPRIVPARAVEDRVPDAVLVLQPDAAQTA